MQTGLRLQILLLLGAVLTLTLVPLHFAVTTYTEVALDQERRASEARRATHTAERLLRARANTQDSNASWQQQLAEEAHAGNWLALGVATSQGQGLAETGAAKLLEVLKTQDASVASHPEHPGVSFHVLTRHDAGLRFLFASTAPELSAGARSAFNLFGLYMGLIGLLVLLLAYLALTRWIVRPLVQLSLAAERVATGARHLEVPTRGASELVQLNQSLMRMTEALVRGEEAQRRRVAEVEEATLKLRTAQDSLVRSERLASVGRLAAGLAHEVGNPLAALMGMQDLLLDSDMTPEQQEDFLRRMRKEKERIHSILRDLLDFARPGSAQGTSATPLRGDVGAAVFDTVALVSPQPSVQDVELSLDVYPDLPEVSLSEEQLVQVLLNLVLNAADACRDIEGGGVVTVRARAESDQVLVLVEDNGPGVPESVRREIFEPFVTTKETGKGTGLGLAVCRGLVEAAGGTLTLDETHSPGARFLLALPSAPPEPPGSASPRGT